MFCSDSICSMTIRRPALRIVLTIIAAGSFGLALSWPLLIVIKNGWTLTGLYEESIGYRYFYNLRQLYDPATYLFLPQGQFTDILQKVIHIALTATGHPPEQLQPRIDLFAFVSLIVFYLFTVVAFAWLIKATDTVVGAVLNLLYWTVPFYVLGGLPGFALLMPDYPAVELAFAIFAAGYIARIQDPFSWTKSDTVLMGIFLGIAAGTKITLVVFPLTVIGCAVIASRGALGPIYAGLVAISGVLTWATIMIIALNGRRTFMFQYFAELSHFLHIRGGMATGPSQVPNWPIWMFERFLAEPTIFKVIYITPIIAILGFVGATRNNFKFVIILSVGAVASNVFLSLRDYAITQIEAGLYLFLVLWTCTTKIWWPVLVSRVPAYISKILIGASAVALLYVNLTSVDDLKKILNYLERNTQHQVSLKRIEAEHPSRHLWLVPNNFYRPASMESAIMKGGGGSSGQWLNPPSPLVRRAAPDVDFAFNESDLSKHKIEGYGAVFFAYTRDLESTIELLRTTYHMNFADWSCRHAVQFDTHGVAICLRP